RRCGGRAAACGQRAPPAARFGVRLPVAAMSDEMSDDKAPKMKSAYELALERLAGQGIEPPREEALSPEVRQRVAEARQKTEAKLAELEILHKDALKKSHDYAAHEKAEEEYRRERRRLEEDRDRQIEKLRRG